LFLQIIFSVKFIIKQLHKFSSYRNSMSRDNESITETDEIIESIPAETKVALALIPIILV